MSDNVIDFPITPVQPVKLLPEYVLHWRTQRGLNTLKTHCRRHIRVQLDNLLQMRQPALVTADGENCGAVMAVSQPDGSIIYKAVLEGEVWSGARRRGA